MKSFAMTLDLKNDPEIIERYKAYHRNVWPEVLEGLRGIGIEKMRLFLHGHRMFMYLEAPDGFDLDRDFQGYTDKPRAQEWDQLMRGFQQQAPGASAHEWWSAMEEVFDIDW